MVLLHHLATYRTPLPCNCLLPGVGAATAGETPEMATPILHGGCYELRPAAASSEKDGSAHSDADQSGGGTAAYRGQVGQLRLAAGRVDGDNMGDLTWQGAAADLPGVFDLTTVARRDVVTVSALIGVAENQEHLLLAACTDGSARLLCPLSLQCCHVFEGIHTEMLTSSTPLLASGPSRALMLLCSGHQGDVVLFDAAARDVCMRLEGHEYDAWCTAVLPMSPSSVSPTSSAVNAAEGGCDATTSAAVPVPFDADEVRLMSGGDDGMLKVYDARRVGAGAVQRMRFDAGVVSITPVLRTFASSGSSSHGGGCVTPTPYCLVGSYDESISLVDVRQLSRPVAQRGRLGGGVWRTSRVLNPLFTRPAVADDRAELGSASSAMLGLMERSHVGSAAGSCGWVNETNVLVLPLMQRGAALVGYDVLAPAAEVFSSEVFYFEEDVADDALVYDTAVLPAPASACADEGPVVATCSFYERRIDLWRVPSGAASRLCPSARVRGKGL